MRTQTYDRIATSDQEDLLTTGEVASILNSSRQHVVDLCERGDLPFTTVGKHRRVRRTDVEALRSRSLRLTRDQRRSLWLAYAVAGRIVADPTDVTQRAVENLERMRTASRGQAVRWLDEWERLLHGPVDKLLAALVSPSPKSRELRQNSPFAGVLNEEERAQVLEAWGSQAAATDRS